MGVIEDIYFPAVDWSERPALQFPVLIQRSEIRVQTKAKQKILILKTRRV